MIVEEVKIDKRHHTVRLLGYLEYLLGVCVHWMPFTTQAVRSVVCNNDTFGRISYYLGLDRGAALSPQDREEVERWDHLKPGAQPPKVLADLFEVMVGAVPLQHGFLALDNWLRTIP